MPDSGLHLPDIDITLSCLRDQSLLPDFNSANIEALQTPPLFEDFSKCVLCIDVPAWLFRFTCVQCFSKRTSDDVCVDRYGRAT